MIFCTICFGRCARPRYKIPELFPIQYTGAVMVTVDLIARPNNDERSVVTSSELSGIVDPICPILAATMVDSGLQMTADALAYRPGMGRGRGSSNRPRRAA